MLRGMMTYIWPRVCFFLLLTFITCASCYHNILVGLAGLVFHRLQYKYQYNSSKPSFQCHSSWRFKSPISRNEIFEKLNNVLSLRLRTACKLTPELREA
jgi:hypothetical protein